MIDEKGEQRYFPTQEELTILVPKLQEYFSLRERSNERKAVVNQTYELVKDFNPDHWTQGKIRLWFNNNKKIYLGNDQPRIPTPLIKPDKLEDPNLNLQIEKTVTPSDPLKDNYILTPLPPSNSISLDPSNSTFIHSDPTQPDPIQPINSISLNTNLVQPILSPYDPKASMNSPSSSISFNIQNATFLETNLFGSSFGEVPTDAIQKNDKNQDDIKFPELPEDSLDFDDKKFHLYEALREINNVIHEIGERDPETRLEKQRLAENKMTKFLEYFKKLEIKDICSNDKTCKQITTPGTKTLGRQYSSITSTYADDPITSHNEIKMDEVSPKVFIPVQYKNRFKPKKELSQNLSYILIGDCQTIDESKTKGEIACCSISNSGSVAYVYLNNADHAYKLCYDDKEALSGFFFKPSSMCIDELGERIFIAGDCRIKSFKMSDLSPDETFSASGTECITSSCISINCCAEKSDLIFGTNGIIAIWDISKKQPAVQKSLKNSIHETKANKQDLDISLIEWSRGRPPDESYKPEEPINEITSLCCLSNGFIALASKKYHAIHVLDRSLRIVGRLVGHVNGVTRLLRLGPNTLLSGSKDHTLKIWDIGQMIPTHHLIRHSSKVASMTAATSEEHLLIFSGEKKNVVLGWDITKRTATFEIRLEDTPIELKFNPGKRKLIIVTKDKIVTYTFKFDP